MEKLPKVFKRKWLKALRSGEYKQGSNQLCDGEGEYCCLGVAAKIQGNSDQSLVGYTNIETHHNNIPKAITGLNDLTRYLMCANDNIHIYKGNKYCPNKQYETKHSFKQIANWIEKNL